MTMMAVEVETKGGTYYPKSEMELKLFLTLVNAVSGARIIVYK